MHLKRKILIPLLSILILVFALAFVSACAGTEVVPNPDGGSQTEQGGGQGGSQGGDQGGGGSQTPSKNVYDMSAVEFSDVTVPYDGEPHSIQIGGTLPAGVSVSYDGNGKVDAGTYTITAHFTGDSKNYQSIPDKTATLTIEKADYDMTGITFDGLTVTYDGNTHPLAVKGNLPAGVNVSYENNSQTTAGAHEVVAHFTGDTKNHNAIPDKKATLTIEKADYDMTGITFDGATVTYDGNPHPLAIKGNLPAGVHVTYDNNNQTTVGHHVVVAHFTGDTQNHNTIPDKQAILIIQQATVAGITFEDETFTYNGEVHSIFIKGDLPDGVNVRYENNGQIDAGEYQVKAIFDTGENYKPIAVMAAKLVIEKADYDMKGITFEGLTVTYDGNPHPLAIKGQLPTDVHVTYDNNDQTTAGEHKVVAHFTGDTQNHNLISDKEATLVIEKATYDMKGITFEGLTVPYDGKTHPLAIQGQLPKDVNVSYENNYHTTAGEHVVIAHFTGDKTNYHEIDDMKATLTIEKIDYDMNGITFPNKTVTYDKQPHPLAIEGNLPQGVYVSYENNSQITAGEHTVTARFTGDANHNKIPDMKATLTIEKATYAMEGITFEGLTVTYDGNTHPLAIQGQLPKDVSVSYENNNRTTAGRHEVIAHFTGDKTNYNKIDDMKATLIIEKADYDLSKVTFEDLTVTYDGNTHPLAIKGDLPDGVSVVYENNEQTDAGRYTVTARFTGKDTVNYNLIPAKEATLIIEKADYDLSGITFEDDTLPYDGEAHSILISGDLPTDVSVAYDGNAMVNAGDYTITAHFTGKDTTNHNLIPDKTATLHIKKLTYDLGDVTFSGEIYTYDKIWHEITIKGTLPQGITVSYEDNKQINAGTYTAIAHFSGKDTVNHELIPDKYATLFIAKRDLTVKITGETTIKYDGNEHKDYHAEVSGMIGDDTVETVLKYSGNMIDKGTYTVTATIANSQNYRLNKNNTLTVTITRETHTVTFKQRNQPNQTVQVLDLAGISDDEMPKPVDVLGYHIAWEEVDLSCITSDMTVNAIENIITYTITYYLNGGTNAEKNPQSYQVTDLTIELADATREKDESLRAGEYLFGGWFLDAQFTLPITKITTEICAQYGNLELYANFVVGTRGVTYEKIDENSYRVTGYSGSDSEVVISSFWKAKPVTEIKDHAFQNRTGIISVTIPESITTIGSSAFSGCTSLASVYITDLKAWCEIDFGYSSANPLSNGATLYLNGDPVTDLNNLTGITKIESYAFYNCKTLTSITIPESVTSIGGSAFYGCTSLATVYWNATNCTKAGSSSSYPIFEGCTALTTVYIGENVASIPSYAFSQCTSLTSVVIPESVTSIGISAFFGCTSLATVYWNATNCTVAGSFGYPIFSGCTALTTVYIGESVEGIPDYAFRGCTGLESITIPESVTSIGEYAFYYCTNLASVDFGDYSSLVSIGDDAFQDCASLESIIIPASIISIGGSAFRDCTSLESITIPDSVTSIGRDAFQDCANIKTATMPTSAIGSIPKSGLQTVILTSGDSIPYYAFQDCASLESIIIPASIISIGGSAFRDCTSLESIIIPDGVTSIGEYAFYNCTSLPSIFIIPESVTSIGWDAFYGCSGIETVLFSGKSNLETIGYGAFSDCTSLESVTIPDSVTSIGRSAFGGCTSLMEVYWNATNCETGGFEGCTALTTVYIGKNVESIPGAAFYNCTSLESVYIMNLKAWCEIDFKSSSANPLSNGAALYLNDEPVTDLNNLTGITEIKQYAFYGCTSLESITIPDSVTSIGVYAFYKCTSLASITIPESVTSIDNYAFSDCTGLVSVDFGNNSSLTSIGGYAFEGCTSLASITIPDSVTSIGASAFRDCTSLASITIPDSVTSIWYAFEGCTDLASVYIMNLQAWCKIDFKSSNSNPLSNGAALYLNGDPVTDLDDFTGITEIKDYAFYGCASLVSITIPDGVTSIGYSAFNSCTSLATVYWNVTNCETTGSYNNPIFGGCTALTTVHIGENVESIPSYAFSQCTSLTSVVIPDSVTSIGNYAFRDSTSLATVYWNATNCTKAGSYDYPIFAGCTALTTVHIGETVESIPAYMFRSCTSLTTVHIGENVASIPDSAFSDCTNLATVYWNATNCTKVGSYDVKERKDYTIFSGCTALTSVYIGENVASIPQYAFYGCTSLDSVYITDIKAWCAIDFKSYSSTPLYYGATLYLNGDPVTDLNNLTGITKIESYAFYNCKTLTSITIPEGVTTIGSSAFEDCKNLATVYWDATNCTQAGSSFYPIFEGCTALTTVHIGENVASIPQYAFKYCTRLTTVYWDATNCTKAGSSSYPIFNSCTALTAVHIGENVEGIPAYAFTGCTNLASVTIPESVISIGDSAFSGCTRLATVYWNATNCTKAGSSSYWIFNSCTALKTVYIGTNVESIPAYAFYKCTSLESITIPESVTSVGNYAFYGCTRLESITIPESVTSVGNYAFYGCTRLATVYWNATNCATAGSSSYPIFSGCTALTAVHIGENVESIPDYAFRDCTSLATVYWNATNCKTTSYNNPIFAGCTVLTTVHIGETVESIPAYAFEDCTSLESITIPESVTSIGNWAFRGCTGLASVDFGTNSSLTSIGNYAFYGCTSLASITIPESVTSIGNYAFSGCTSLASITIPESVTSIGGYAFYQCTSLAKVYYGGTPTQWRRISISSYNDNLTKAARYYYSEGTPSAEQWAESNNWWHYDPDTGEIQIWKKES